MKKIFMLSVVTLLFIFPYTAYAETAYPTEASVIVDGKTVNFCAYNLYGSNYFMLREVAMSLRETGKQFNVKWSDYKGISLYSDKPYESAGTEFLQSADGEKNALFSVPDINYIGGDAYEEKSLTLVGYNIADSNYFKIRDIARIFNFYVGYSDGYITIDTSRPYEFETPYEPSGEMIGMAHEADLPLFINEMPIVSYYAPCETAYSAEQLERIRENPRLNGVYVSARDLEQYGFDTQIYEDAVWLTRNKDKKFGMLDGEIVNAPPTGVSEVFASDIKVYLDGADTRNVTINGEPYISAAELIKYGDVSKTYGDFYYRLFSNKVNIDFLRKDLTEKFEANPIGTAVELNDRSVLEAEFPDVILPDASYKCDGTSEKKADMWKYEYTEESSGRSGTRYIGGMLNDRENGMGIKEEYQIPMSGNSMQARQAGGYDRGEFVDGKLVDGVRIWTSAAYPPHYRYEGAMMNGYHRVCNDSVGKEFRFGYRVEREGTIENGEYCGYYRAYDDSGALVFEGDYADYVKETN